MTAPTRRAGGLDANARGIAVLVVALVVGLLLLLNAGGSGDATGVTTVANPSTTVDTSGTGTDVSTTSAVDSVTTAPTSPTTTAAPSPDREPGEVTVVVLNADGPAGSAGAATETIGASGYQTGDPRNANGDVTLDTTAVYYAEGFQAEASAVALVLGKAPEAVQPLPDPVPGPGAEESNVVVVLGQDTAPAAGVDDTTTTTVG